jgi:hypothetical protein
MKIENSIFIPLLLLFQNLPYEIEILKIIEKKLMLQDESSIPNIKWL